MMYTGSNLGRSQSQIPGRPSPVDNLTEIAFKLNYSSVAHLSTQFKNTTGITPSAFQRIIFKRRKIAQQKAN